MTNSFLLQLFDASVAASNPALTLAEHLPSPPKGKTIVVGAGKAAASMARAVEDAWQESLSGLVVTRYGHGLDCKNIEVIEAAHPVPDAQGRDAAERILAMFSELGPDDLALCLISGGGSALLSLPGFGLSLKDKQDLNNQLLKSGASISEMNCVRKHLSAIKGGRLATAAYPARVLTLAISDVPGDDLAVIGSGPTVPDSTTLADARAIIENYNIDAGSAVFKALENPLFETPKPGDKRLQGIETRLIATPQMALEAAAEVAQKAGFATSILSESIEGEACEVAKVMAGIAMQVVRAAYKATLCSIFRRGNDGDSPWQRARWAKCRIFASSCNCP